MVKNLLDTCYLIQEDFNKICLENSCKKCKYRRLSDIGMCKIYFTLDKLIKANLINAADLLKLKGE